MARLWSCGFELQTVTSDREWDTTTGSPSINTSVVRSGAASLRCNPSSATAYIQHAMQSADAATRMYLRAYVRVASLPSAKTMIISWTDSSPFGYGIVLQTDGKLTIEGTNGTLFTSPSALTLATNTWYRIELDMDDNNDIATAYVDGTQVLQLTSADVFGGHLARFGPQFSCTTDIYLDDLAVNDTSGSTQNALPGAGSIVHLRPNAAGDNNGFATAVGGTAGAANNYTRVSETTPDDATTYNNTTATGTTTIDDFNVTDSATAGINSGDTITLVQVGQRAASSAATAASIVTRIKATSGGTVAESASTPVNTTAWNTHNTAIPKLYRLTAYVKPSSTAWTPSDLDTMQIGYRGNVNQTTQRRITAIWALVEYVPSSTDATTSGTGRMTLGASAAITSERVTAGTGRMTLDASASTYQPGEDHSTSGLGRMVLDASAAVTSNRTTAGTGRMTLDASASIHTGSGSAYVWSPDTANLPLTDLELTVSASRTDGWRPATDQVLLSKWGDEPGEGSWLLYIDADGGGDPTLVGRPVLVWTPTGDAVDGIEAAATDRAPIDGTGTVTMRVFLDTDNGAGGWTVVFEYLDENGAWVPFGDAVTGSGTTSISTPSEVQDFEVGASEDGTANHFVGRVYFAQIRDGRSGAILAAPDFTIWPTGTLSFSDDFGQLWTVSGPASLVSPQQPATIAIVGPLASDECTSYVDWTHPRTGVGVTCDHPGQECCSRYRVRVVGRVDGAIQVSSWTGYDDESCLTWDDDQHLIRTRNAAGPLGVGIGGTITWDRDRPFTSDVGVDGTRFVTSAPPGGRNLHLTTAVESEAALLELLAVLNRPLVLVSPSDADEVWAAPISASVKVVKIGRVRQVSADFIATGPEPGPQLADVG